MRKTAKTVLTSCDFSKKVFKSQYFSMITYKVNTAYPYEPHFPGILKSIPDVPKKLFYAGADPESWQDLPKVAIVGSRKMSGYGQSITSKLTSELANSGVVIISGLALGVDSEAHKAALDAGGLTIAVLPSPIERIYPASHLSLANRIMAGGGTLISEYGAGHEVFPVNFIARNRLISGLADVLLITEAAINSGTMHTARFALEQGKTVMCVPGNITNPGSEGTNNLIKSGAVPVTDASDIFFALHLKPTKRSKRVFRGTKPEIAILELIADGVRSQEELAVAAGLDGAALASTLTALEINGRIRPEGGGYWVLA